MSQWHALIALDSGKEAGNYSNRIIGRKGNLSRCHALKASLHVFFLELVGHEGIEYIGITLPHSLLTSSNY